MYLGCSGVEHWPVKSGWDYTKPHFSVSAVDGLLYIQQTIAMVTSTMITKDTMIAIRETSVSKEKTYIDRHYIDISINKHNTLWLTL